MATIVALQEKVKVATLKVEKIKGTIQKHEAAAAKKLAALAEFGITADNMVAFKWDEGKGTVHYWPICEIEGKLKDAQEAERKLRDAVQNLTNRQTRLDAEIEKDRFLNDQAPEVIKEFLENWKQKAYDWHIEAHECYLELSAELKTAKEVANKRYKEHYPMGNKWGTAYKDFMKNQTELTRIISAMGLMGGFVAKMATYLDETERLAWLEKELEAEKNNKMFGLINRVVEKTGTIQDANGLRIDSTGNLNGIIAGEKGTAKVETVGAGGKNIQCYHFRTLVHEIKFDRQGQVIASPWL